MKEVFRLGQLALVDGTQMAATMRLAEEALQKLGVNAHRLQAVDSAVLSSGQAVPALIGRTERGAFLHVPNHSTVYHESFTVKVLSADGAKLEFGERSLDMLLPSGARVTSKDGLSITTAISPSLKITQVSSLDGKVFANERRLGMYDGARPQMVSGQALVAGGGDMSAVRLGSDPTRILQTSYSMHIDRSSAVNMARTPIEKIDFSRPDFTLLATPPGRLHLFLKGPADATPTHSSTFGIVSARKGLQLRTNLFDQSPASADEFAKVSRRSLEQIFGKSVA